VRAGLLLSYAACAACACLACESAPTPTETIVVVDAEPGIRALTAKLYARVEGESDRTVRFEGEFKTHWQVRLAVVPFGGDPKRKFKLALRALRADGTTLVETRVHTGFVADAKRYHHVLLGEDCLGVECGEDSTCHEGACDSANVPTRALSASDCSGRSCRESSNTAADGGEHDATADGRDGSSEGEDSPDCAELEQACAGRCVARDSLEHCGACDRDCTDLPNVDGATQCNSDHCAFEPSACSPGHGDCNGDPDDGCETELNAPANCGACDATCDEPQLCAATGDGHACVAHCPAERPTACEGSCVDLDSSAEHCGACGAACAAGARCEAGRCGAAACAAGEACTSSECRSGQTRCEASGAVCEAVEPVADGTTCGAAAAASCEAGRCTCGISDGRHYPFDTCASEADCLPGSVCSDWNGSGAFVCSPLCDADADCEPYRQHFQDIRCSAALCSDGKDPGIRACVELESHLAPAYMSSTCCGGPGSEGVSADGCSDGTREAFTDPVKFPSIAGCEAKWPLASMRDPRSGPECGNSLGVDCKVPADACATGWHVCGAPPYGPVEIQSKLTAQECSTQPGRFGMALGDANCEPCVDKRGKGSACCGAACVQSYGSCVFNGQTAWFGWETNAHVNLCSWLLSTMPGQGVMCCRGY
jgi:Stigma-specific protein, Stig1